MGGMWDYLQMHSIHRAKSPQADTSRISQRLYEEAEIKKQRLHEMQREKDLKEDRLFFWTLRSHRFALFVFGRLRVFST
eukprot:s2265_g6.t1